MSRIEKKTGLALRFVLLSALLFLWTACADGNDPGGPQREPVQLVDVTPEPAELEPGDTVRLTARPLSRDGIELPGRTVAWTSDDTAVAAVTAGGLVTARAPGGAVIFATVEGKVGSAVVTVNAPAPTPVHRVEVLPVEASAIVGGIVRFTAVALDANGFPLERAVTWRSSNPAIAQVDGNGLALAVAAGTVQIIAHSEGKEAYGTLSIEPVRQPVARLEPVTGGVVTLFTGDSQQLGVRAYAADGTELFGRMVTWTSTNDVIARVNAAGLVEARTVGNADVVAHVEGVTQPVSIDVRSRIARIDITPRSLALAPGEEATSEAIIRGFDGSVLQRPLTWTTSNAAVATVDANGRVHAHAAGTAVILAKAEGQEGWLDVRVVPWVNRPLLQIGDSVPPTTLFTRTFTDNTGTVRTTRVRAQDGSFGLALTGANSGRFELRFFVWIVTDGQAAQPGQYVYRGDFQYDYFSHAFVLSSHNGATLTARVQTDGRMQIVGSLEPGLPPVTLLYGPQL